MSFYRTGALAAVEKISIENWRKHVVASSVRQDPAVISTQAEFDIDEKSFLYVRTRAVSAYEHHGPNGNGDAFEDATLAKAYKTFIRRGNYLNHESESIDKAVGIILDAKYWTDPGTFYVECLMAVDRAHPIADKIEKGIADSVSMGALVDECSCSVCDKVATNETEYCTHLRDFMGKEYNGKKVFAYNRGVNFYELSWVTVPADPDAKALQVIAEKTEKSDKFDVMLKLADAYQGSVKEAGPVFCSEIGCNRSSHDSANGKQYCPIHLPEKEFNEALTPPKKEAVDVCNVCASDGGKSNIPPHMCHVHKGNVKEGGPVFCSEIGCNRPSHDKDSKTGKQYCSIHLPMQEEKKEAAPQPPQLKKEPKPDPTLQSTVESIIGKEVQHEVERELISKVRDAMKKLQPQKTMNQTVSDDSILQAVRTELSKRMSQPSPVAGSLDAVVNKTLAELEEKDSQDVFSIDLLYTARPVGKVAGQRVMQLFSDGGTMSTGLFCIAAKDGLSEEEIRQYYINRFGLQENKKSEPDNNNETESLNTMGNLIITYEPGKTLATSMFVARKGNLVAKQSAANLLSEATQKMILAAESGKTAAGKVEYGVGDYDSTKGKTDRDFEMGKDSGQPGDVVKKEKSGVADTKFVNDTYDSTKGKIDRDFDMGKDPIQPSQVVSKYAGLIGGRVAKLAENKATGAVRVEVEGGSLARLAQVWKVQAQIEKSKTAMISGTPDGWARETTKPVAQEPLADINKVTTVARENPKGPAGAAPSGSRGGEQIKYYQQWDKGTLAETGEGWARKVASLNAKVKAAEAKATQADTENRLLKAALEKTKKAQEDEKRNNLVEAIMQRLVATGNLEPQVEAVFELQERGLNREDAVAKATATLHDTKKKEFAALEITALEKLKDVINNYSMNTRTAELDSMKPLDVPITGMDNSSYASPEDRLRASWS